MRLLFPILLALVLVPTALAAGPREQKIAGTISANSGSSLTINSGDRSLTCLVRGDKAQTALARWGVGVKAAMACKRDGDRLLLTRLARLGSKDGTSSTSTTTGDTTGTTGTTGTTTHEPPHETPTTTTAPPQTRRDARGRVSALGAGTITVTRDDGTSLTCTVTDGQAHSIADGAPVGTAVLLVCSGDGDHPALLNLQRLDSSTPPPPLTTAPHPTTTTAPPSAAPPTPAPPTSPSTDRRYAKGLVTALSSDSVTVKPDDGTDSLRCRITPASDSASAAVKLSLGAHVGIVCRPDGSTLVLAGSTLVG
ncbi:MAG TPA: hypothetical protein VJ375_09990 [Gaiellaceae bacterium]|nr:hypothetical protein [Gaiellaceae bacterium]